LFFAELFLSDHIINGGEMKELFLVFAALLTGFTVSCNKEGPADPKTPVNRELQADAGTIGLWHFNETSGQTLYDSSGNGRNMTLGSDATTETKDPLITASDMTGFGNCLRFDKTNSQYAHAGYSFPLSANSLTVEFWIKSTDTGSYAHPIASGGMQFYFQRNPDGGFYVQIGDGSNWTTAGVGSNIADGNWHYVAVTYDYGTTTMAIYIDGSQVMKNSAVSRAVQDPSALYVGGRPSNTFLTGYMDEVRIYNFARSASEISSYWTRATQ
jgi:hypothetical protein